MKISVFRQRLSDDEHVARIRRSVERADRWGFWLVVFHVAVLVALGWFFAEVIQKILGIVQPAQPPGAPLVWAGFACGTVIGMGFGVMAHRSIETAGSVLNGNIARTERLLLDYHDALQEAGPRMTQPNPRRCTSVMKRGRFPGRRHGSEL